jgi:hypothetical protein
VRAGGPAWASGQTGRQDSNLGMAESKSTDFPFAINDYSEKSWKFDLFLINGLRVDSECTALSWHVGCL